MVVMIFTAVVLVSFVLAVLFVATVMMNPAFSPQGIAVHKQCSFCCCCCLLLLLWGKNDSIKLKKFCHDLHVLLLMLLLLLLLLSLLLLLLALVLL